MHTSRTARKVVAGVSAAVVSLLLVGGTAATITSDDAGRGIKNSSPELGRGI
jgi:hypothetical protein